MARGFVHIDTRTISLKCKQETSRAGYLVLSKTKSLSRKGCNYREGVAVLAVGTVYLFIIKQCLQCDLHALFYTGRKKKDF